MRRKQQGKAGAGAKAAGAQPDKPRKRSLFGDDSFRAGKQRDDMVQAAVASSLAPAPAPPAREAAAPAASTGAAGPAASGSRSPGATQQQRGGPPASTPSADYALYQVIPADGGLAVADDGGVQGPWHSSLWHGCTRLDAWRKLNTINEGTYGVVFRAEHRRSGVKAAIKEFKLGVSGEEGFPQTALQEINTLLRLQHENIVRVLGMAQPALPAPAARRTSWSPGGAAALPGCSGRRAADSVFMVMEYLPHDLRALMNAMDQPFPLAEVKTLLLQLLEAVAHMHAHGIMHRDLKTSNLLMDDSGRLVVCDFGLATPFTAPPRAASLAVVTLYYRAPEVLLGLAEYGPAIDVWSVGCIFAELLTNSIFLRGTSETNQLKAIFKATGAPSADTWPGWAALPLVPDFASVIRAAPRTGRLRDVLGLKAHAFGGAYLPPSGLDLLAALLTLDPAKRITAADALRHPFFQEAPKPKARDGMWAAPETNKQRHGTSDVRVTRGVFAGLDG